jgi:predicted membrane-bound spermidine synthase
VAGLAKAGRLTLYLGVFLLTLSGLMFEIGLTRIFSATIWYHYAFVAISVALLGWGFGGFLLHLAKRRVAFTLDRAALLALAYAASLPLALFLIVRVPFHSERLAFYFAVSLFPFLLAGMALSMVFDLHRESAGRVYFADLLGASAGALLVTFLLSWLGGETAVLAVALAPAAAAACLSPRLRLASAALAVVVLAAVVMNERTGLFKIRSAPAKGLYQHVAATPGSRIVLTGWNAYSRIDAVTGFPPPFLARLYIDSDAWTNVHSWDGKIESLASYRGWYRALPFQVVPEHPKTLVIGPGGGSDVLVSLAAGSESVTAAEMNPLMLQFVRHFGAAAGNLYDHPNVEAILTEGRTFIRRTDRRFDVILLGFVDSWAAVASGGLSLSENHLYTTEAFRAYYDHLTDGGALVILRWDVDIPRLVANSIAVLGREDAGRRLAVLLEKRRTEQDPAQMIFILKRSPFTEDETARMMGWSLAVPVIVPSRHVDEPYASVLDGRMSVAEWEKTAPTRVDPVTDDRPFFFARQKPWGLPASMRNAFRKILLPLALLSILLVALGRPRGQPARPYLASVAYFSCLGVAFIAVELGLLQQLTLLLGHPIFTLSILLFTLLASGGIGSYRSSRHRPAGACVAAALLGVVYAVVLPLAVPVLLPLPLAARIVLAMALVAPLGFVMGIPFPRGLTSVGRGPFPGPPFYWGLNGIFSVAGSLATMVAAVTLGFQVAMIGGAIVYLGAALTAGALEASTARANAEAA